MDCCNSMGASPGVTPGTPAPTAEAPPPASPEAVPTPDAPPGAQAPTTYASDVAHITDQLRDALARLNQLGITVPQGTQPTTGTATRFDVGADQPLLDAALGELRRSPTGAPILAQLERSNVQMRVLDDSQFAQMGETSASAFYDPKVDTMYVRRTWLQKSPGKAASTIAHEGQHALDDISGLGMSAAQRRTAELARGGAVTPAIVQQAGWEVNMAKETRGYLVQGQVLKELGLVDPTKVGGPLLTAAQGGSDRATYDAVFRGIISSPEGGYNPEGRQAAPLYL